MRKFVRAMCHPGAQSAIGSIMVLLLTIALIACGGDSGTSPSEVIPDSVPGSPSSSSVKKSSSSSVIRSSSSVIQSGDNREGSSNSKRSSSSSSKESSSSAKATSSSSSAKIVSSSSKRNEGDPSSSSQKTTSSSSVAPASSSSKKVESSSSEYVPFDHSWTLANVSKVGEGAYKRFTDPRNGRSYYYITITSTREETKGKSVTVMAENLNIGEMVLGTENQSDDNRIERYCYNNDTTKCDEFGGLYQWAEMMQLPSRCNTESCTDLIQPNHRGICPEGWRLFTWDDYEIVDGYDDKFDDGVKGLRSTYGFRGTNQSGFSLTGAGLRKENGTFSGLEEKIAWFRPEEYELDKEIRAHHGLVSASGSSPQEEHRELKTKGFSVRCTKLE